MPSWHLKHRLKYTFWRLRAYIYFKRNLDPSVRITRNRFLKSDKQIILVYARDSSITLKIPCLEPPESKIKFHSCLNAYGLQKLYELTGLEEVLMIKLGRQFFCDHPFHPLRYKMVTALANLAAQRDSIKDFEDWFM